MSNSTGSAPQDINLKKGSLYPNPTSKFLKVELSDFNVKKIRIQVLNSVGQLLLDESFTNNNTSFNIQDFPVGVYFVKLISDNQLIEIQKIIKQ